MPKKTKCADCRHAYQSKAAAGKGKPEYRCGNFNSEAYMAVLNVNPNGHMTSEIVWTGCEDGEVRE